MEKVGSNRLLLMTAHRREYNGKPMENMFHAIRKLAEKHEDNQVIYSITWTQRYVKLQIIYLVENERIQLIEPLDVIGFIISHQLGRF